MQNWGFWLKAGSEGEMRYRFACMVIATVVAWTSAASALGMLDATRQLVIFEEFAQRCQPDGSVDVTALMDDLGKALVRNAMLVHPASGQEETQAAVDTFLHNMRQQAKSMPDTHQIGCSDPAAIAFAKELSTRRPSIAADLLAGAEQIGQYDRLVTLSGVAGGPETYAVASIHDGLIAGIAGARAHRCATPKVMQIELVKREPATFTNNLPPFILPPVTYHERWQADCGGEQTWYSVTFRQDSEGSSGLWKIAPE